MKVYTNFDSPKDGSLIEHLKLALAWANNWRKHGFEPVFLNDRSGMDDNPEGGLYADLRVFNYGWQFAPAKQPAGKLRQFLPNMTLVYGRQAAWTALRNFEPAIIENISGKEYKVPGWETAPLVWYSTESMDLADPLKTIQEAR